MKVLYSIIGIIFIVLIIQYIRFRNGISNAKKSLENGQCFASENSYFPFRGEVCKDKYGNV